MRPKQMNKVKPVILITKMDGGGMETFCLNLLRAWGENGIDATLYTSYLGGAREQEISPDIEHVSWNLRARKSFWKLAQWLNSRPEDPCLALSQELAVILLVLKKFRLIRNRIYFRESTDVKHHYGRLFKRIMRWLWPSLDGIVEQSRTGLNETLGICNGRLPKSLVVRNIQSQVNGDMRFSVQGECRRLACIGSFKPMKGQHFLVEQLLSDDSSDWRLIFWGDGERRGEVEKFVAEHGLSERISFCDWTAEVTKAYERCDIVVIPSDYEGLPNVMLEAILHGKRVSVRPTCTGACELMDEIGLGVSWPWRKALEIPEKDWIVARDRLLELCDPKTVSSGILGFMSSVNE